MSSLAGLPQKHRVWIVRQWFLNSPEGIPAKPAWCSLVHSPGWRRAAYWWEISSFPVIWCLLSWQSLKMSYEEAISVPESCFFWLCNNLCTSQMRRLDRDFQQRLPNACDEEKWTQFLPCRPFEVHSNEKCTWCRGSISPYPDLVYSVSNPTFHPELFQTVQRALNCLLENAL